MVTIHLQKILDEKGISQRGLAKAIDIRQETIRNMCNNTAVYIRIDHFDKICAYLGCGIEELISFSSS